LLEGKNVNLRVMEKEDINFLFECVNDVDFWGEYTNPLYGQISKSGVMSFFDNPSDRAILIEMKRFIIQKKDGTRIGITWHFIDQPYETMEIGYFFVPSERGKGYGTEAVQLMVDYLFLLKSIVRIQAMTNIRNKASQRVLEKAGFRIEGTVRKLAFVRGVWTDWYLHSILREEWKEPKILAKTTSQSRH
jgi:RimJ/RimL family protein N-acetyltransferase